jgi:hypothetical protein
LRMLGIGCSALRGDLSLRRAGPAEDEVFEVFEEKDEHQAQQGPYSFPCTSTHSLENYPRNDPPQDKARSCCIGAPKGL